jgi:hypothetical protein
VTIVRIEVTIVTGAIDLPLIGIPFDDAGEVSADSRKCAQAIGRVDHQGGVTTITDGFTFTYWQLIDWANQDRLRRGFLQVFRIKVSNQWSYNDSSTGYHQTPINQFYKFATRNWTHD